MISGKYIQFHRLQFHVRTALYVAARHLIVIAFQSHSRCHGIRIFGCPAVEEGAVPVVRTGETFHLLGIEYLVSEVAWKSIERSNPFQEALMPKTADELGSGTARSLRSLAVMYPSPSTSSYISRRDLRCSDTVVRHFRWQRRHARCSL